MYLIQLALAFPTIWWAIKMVCPIYATSGRDLHNKMQPVSITRATFGLTHQANLNVHTFMDFMDFNCFISDMIQWLMDLHADHKQRAMYRIQLAALTGIAIWWATLLVPRPIYVTSGRGLDTIQPSSITTRATFGQDQANLHKHAYFNRIISEMIQWLMEHHQADHNRRGNPSGVSNRGTSTEDIQNANFE